MQPICVVGLGRVGLPTAALAAGAGREVVGVDRDPAVLRAISLGQVGAAEPGLRERVGTALASGRLRLAERPEPASAYLICVPTPLTDGRAPDLRPVEAALAAVAEVAPPGAVVVLESTVPVGTTDRLAAEVRARCPGLRMACAPERVLPGDALREIAENPRVIGGVDRESAEAAADLVGAWVRGPIRRTDARTAELVKLLENACRDVELALAHTVVGTARALGAEPFEVLELVRQHPRVRLLQPGPGVGGHCLPIDPWFLVDAVPEATGLFRAARLVNDGVPAEVLDAIERAVPPGGQVAVLGVAYKPDTDDLRESPALAVAHALARTREVVVCDPLVGPLPGLRSVDLDEALRAPVVALLVPHRAFGDLRVKLAGRTVIDPTGTLT